MKSYSRKTRAAMLLAATGLVGGFTVTAAASAQASTVCNFEVRSLTSKELQDGNGEDEIRFKLGDDTYGTWTFWDDWTRNDSLGYPDEDYIGTVAFTLYEMDGVFRQTIDSDTVGCSVGDHVMDLTGNGAIYKLSYRITS